MLCATADDVKNVNNLMGAFIMVKDISSLGWQSNKKHSTVTPSDGEPTHLPSAELNLTRSELTQCYFLHPFEGSELYIKKSV